MQETPHRETGFEIHLQTHVAQLARVIGSDAPVDTRAECTGRPSAHAVAAAAIEQPFERQCGRVAVSIAETSEEAIDQRAFLSEPKVFDKTQVGTEILGVADTQQGIVFVFFLIGETYSVQGVEQVAVRLEVEAQRDGSPVGVFLLVCVEIGARKPGDQL